MKTISVRNIVWWVDTFFLLTLQPQLVGSRNVQKANRMLHAVSDVDIM